MAANDSVEVSFDAYADPWYFGVLHVNTVLSCFSSAVAFYFIVARSPPSIGVYKWYLLNISASALLYDVHVSLLYAPQPLLPALGFCSKGLINGLGWNIGGALPFLVMVVLLGDTSLSVMWGLAYRYSVLAGQEKRLHSKAGISFMVLSQSLYMTPSIIIYTLSAQHHELIRSSIIQKYPRIQEYFIEDSCAALSFDTSGLALAFVIMCAVQFSAVAPPAVALMTLSFKALKKHQSKMSAKTLRMHRQLLVSLIFQVAVPFITVYVPSTLMALLAMAGVNAPGVYKSLFVIGTLHSFVNTVMMIAHIGPYRNALRDLMRTQRFKNSIFIDSRIQI